jgi:formylglycine-generating enzyme required for sulfatase activity
MGGNPSKFKDCGMDCPVEMVSWDDIQGFLEKLNTANDGFEYSLPTEAQWEYSARAGTTSTFAFGDSLGSADANVDGRYPHGSAQKGPWIRETVKVGSYKPNAWGIYDMHGNVAEWVEDIYSSSYEGLPTDGSVNVSIGYRKYRVDRGGSWLTFARAARSSERGRNLPGNRSVATGFRIAAKLK